MKNRIIAGVLITLAVTAGITACGNKQTQYWNDAPRTKVYDESPADIIAMPDGFTNVASKCVYGHDRLFVAFHNDGSYASIFVVPNDNTCK